MNPNLPTPYDFDTHYRGDGFKPLQFKFTLDGNIVDFTGSEATMQVRIQGSNKRAKIVYEFSSIATDPDKLLTLSAGGILTFPLIKSFDIPANNYIYDLEIKDTNGVFRTFMAGTFNVEQDITVKI